MELTVADKLHPQVKLLLHCLVQWLHLVLWVLAQHAATDIDHSQSSGASGLVFQVEDSAMPVMLFAEIKQTYN
jgi:hypothetical protein